MGRDDFNQDWAGLIEDMLSGVYEWLSWLPIPSGDERLLAEAYSALCEGTSY